MTVLRVVNEFADVTLRIVQTRNGERLEISSPRRGTSIRLDAVELEALTWQTSDVFSGMLKESVGPTGDGVVLGLVSTNDDTTIGDR